jgi:Transposase family tnp2
MFQIQYRLIILIDDNISPRDRTKRKNVMILGVIAGPGQPKDFNSYFVWLRNECHRLARGVLTWDAAAQEFFLLRAYLIMVIGDMPAIAHMMYMKGHNGMLCCRACYIHGTRNRTDGKTTYYPVLTRPDNTGYTIQELLATSRTHETFLEDLREIDAEQGITKKRRQMQQTGLSGRSITIGRNHRAPIRWNPRQSKVPPKGWEKQGMAHNCVGHPSLVLAILVGIGESVFLVVLIYIHTLYIHEILYLVHWATYGMSHSDEIWDIPLNSTQVGYGTSHELNPGGPWDIPLN